MGKRRVTLHSGRKGRSGNFFAGHNDRDKKMTAESAEHIDKTKSISNVYWQVVSDADGFESAEMEFYRAHFSAGLAAKNSRYISQRHPERCRRIEDVYADPKTCPEEVILQLGTRNEKIESSLLDAIMKEQIQWEEENFPQLKYLDYALHRDEPNAADHVHTRRSWIAHDKDGNEIVSERAALKEMGIERPNPDKKEGRYNNAKMTFTRMCREHLQKLCRENGLDIEDTPKEKSKSGRSLDELKTQTLKNKIDELTKKAAVLKTDIEMKGNEQENLEKLRKVLKEKPVYEGVLSKKVIGYKNSPAAIDELFRLAQLGGQAAEEREARKKAEGERDKAKKGESAAKKEAQKAKADFDFLLDAYNELDMKFKALNKRAVYANAPKEIQRFIRDAVRDVAELDASRGSSTAQAVIQYFKGCGDEDWKRDWLYMTEADKDELSLRKDYSDAY